MVAAGRVRLITTGRYAKTMIRANVNQTMKYFQYVALISGRVKSRRITVGKSLPRYLLPFCRDAVNQLEVVNRGKFTRKSGAHVPRKQTSDLDFRR